MGGVLPVPAAAPGSGEPMHPQFGSLTEALKQAEADIRAGHDISIYVQRALSWFTREYWKIRQKGDGE